MKKIAVILSGCGFKDGSEVTESVSSLIALSQEGADFQCFAPDIDYISTDHQNDQPGELRNTLKESSRISRGSVGKLKAIDSNQFDGLLFPGGFGAALHLSDWAKKGASCHVLPEVSSLIKNFHEASKPIAGICIAPVLIAKTLGSENIILTIGNDRETAQEITKTGAEHENCGVDDYISDREHKILTTPAYMLDAQPHQVFSGISKMIKEFVEMS